jgi:hypothetical protein
LCGIECESQPFYDEQLAFVYDLSKTAKNYGSSYSTQTNALGEKHSRLMTPVLIFMDKNGNCWDYTYHNIEIFINSWYNISVSRMS